MSDLIHLDPQPVEVRDLEKRLVAGRIIPYGEQILVRGKPESFTQGALAAIESQKTKLFDHHSRGVGKIKSLEERQDGAYAEFYVSKTARGDELLELAKDGVLSFSPGFIPGSQTREGVHTRIQAMPEVSLVSMPAYQSAEVLSVREKEGQVPDVEVEEKVEAPPVVDLAPLETRMEGLETQFEKLHTSITAPPPAAQGHNITPFRWFVAQVKSQVNRDDSYQERFMEDWETAKPQILETRAALADVTGDFPGVPGTQVDASGLIAEEYLASQLVNVLDTRRPLLRSLGSFPMPRSGVIRIPVVTQHTLVDARGAQKADIPTRELIVNDLLFEAAWFAGGVDVSLELIRMAEIPVLNLIWNDLLGQYAIATEDAVADVFDAAVTAGGFTFGGTALATNTYAAFVTAVATAALVVRTNTGEPATHLFVTDAQWIALIAMVDADGRRILATDGPSNSDAQAAINAEAFTLPGGIIVQHVPGIARAYLTNQAAYKVADGGVERVESINVQKMGHDIGLLGRILQFARIPSGVYVFGASA